MDYSYIFEQIKYITLLVALGVIPSAIWLLYYLKKDDHSEPKKLLVEVFLLGALSTVFALVLEGVFLKALYFFGFECKDCDGFIPDFLGAVNFEAISVASFIIFSGLALIEETTKYLAVKIRILKDRNFDEPVDAMIYLVVGGLGFAAAENIGYIFTSDPSDILGILYFRFFTAVFLHALASAIVGYFFALSIIHKKNHLSYLIVGIAGASLLHAVFNITVTSIKDTSYAWAYLVVLLILMSQGVSYLFKRIKKIHYNMQSQS